MKYHNFYKKPLEYIPIHRLLFNKPEVTSRIDSLVDQIIESKRLNNKADTLDLEKEIDWIIYELYELTPDEIRVIEEAA